MAAYASVVDSPLKRGMGKTQRLELAIDLDAALLSKVQGGDESAMARLYDTHSTIVYSVAFRVLRDASAAEDVLQDVFLKIWRKPASFVILGGNLNGWLAATARNRAIDVLRERKRRPTDSIENAPLPASDNVLAQVERKLMVERTRFLISKLSKVQREALEMAFFEGLTHAEIDERTKVPLGTIKTRIRDALQLLGNALRQQVSGWSSPVDQWPVFAL